MKRVKVLCGTIQGEAFPCTAADDVTLLCAPVTHLPVLDRSRMWDCTASAVGYERATSPTWSFCVHSLWRRRIHMTMRGKNNTRRGPRAVVPVFLKNRGANADKVKLKHVGGNQSVCHAAGSLPCFPRYQIACLVAELPTHTLRFLKCLRCHYSLFGGTDVRIWI